ncbi:MAG: hypothetical protein CMJ19_16905 [Phycisphaeraceae bacterium]|nr:hypothetical protein [Phycisphaeraceae bacterium]
MKSVESHTKSRYQQIADDLRQQILHGQTGPGEKLPTFDDLVTMFDTSRSIVQMAIGQLRDQGFVRSDGRRGMFVADYPPHLFRYGILFPGHPGDAFWSRFNIALCQEATRLAAQTPGYRFEFYYDLHKNAQTPGVDLLLDDVKQQTLAGLIVMPFCDHVLKLPHVAHSDIPVLHLFGSTESERLPSLTTDHSNHLTNSVLPKLKATGAQRVAALSMAEHPSAELLGMIHAAGLQTRKSWIQYVSRDYPETIRRIVWLLYELPADQRPDGILILDDNLIEHVMLGLNDCELKVGKDVHVFAQNNWPCESPNMLPIHRFGVHTGQLLIKACRLIDDMRQGKSIPEFQSMPSWFEKELPKSVSFDDELPPCIEQE